jgi:hypothetical protein
MARRSLVVPLGILLAACALSACGSGTSPEQRAADACTAHTEGCRQAKVVAQQTHEYEQAGASHREAACLANVTGRMKPPRRHGTYVLGSGAAARAIDRCHIRPESLAKIGAWVQTHFTP